MEQVSGLLNVPYNGSCISSIIQINKGFTRTGKMSGQSLILLMNILILLSNSVQLSFLTRFEFSFCVYNCYPKLIPHAQGYFLLTNGKSDQDTQIDVTIIDDVNRP